jgi:hypothetical protein
VDSPFARIATDVPTRPLVEALEGKPHLWGEITARQTTPGTPHRDSETIFLRWPKDQSITAAFEELESVDYPALRELPEARPLFAEVMKRTNAKELGRALIVKLKGQGQVDQHVDEGKYADAFERFHLVLSTGDGAHFFVEKRPYWCEVVHMRERELWWFNHKKRHWVANLSDEPRIHMIIDAKAPDYRRERETHEV